MPSLEKLFTQNLAHLEKVLLYGFSMSKKLVKPGLRARVAGGGEEEEEEEEEEASVAAGSVYRPSSPHSSKPKPKATQSRRDSAKEKWREERSTLCVLPYKKRLFAVVRINEREEVGKEVKCLF